MSEFKGTPGPWSTGSDEDAHIVYDAALGYVADCGSDDGDAEAERANARLIAAAPDLLAACKSAVVYAALGCANSMKSTKKGRSEAGKVLEQLHTAIAKAEGE